MVFGERLKILRRNKGLTREELAKKLKLSYWALSKYETGEREPDYGTLKALADFFGTPIDYILGRIEETELPGQNLNSSEYTINTKFNLLFLKEDLRPEIIPNIITIPVLKNISTSEPSYTKEDIIKFTYIPEEETLGGECFYIQVSSNSMTGSRIYPGDFVLIHRQVDFNNGEILLIETNGEITLRRLYKIDDKIIIHTDNPFEPVICSENAIKILGKVLHVKFEL